MARPEDQIQKEIVKWARQHSGLTTGLDMLYCIQNGGRRKPYQYTYAKAMGELPGVPDLHLPVPRPGSHGLWLEVKAPGGRLSPKQKEYIEKLKHLGHEVIIPRSAGEAMEGICDYLGVWL